MVTRTGFRISQRRRASAVVLATLTRGAGGGGAGHGVGGRDQRPTGQQPRHMLKKFIAGAVCAVAGLAVAVPAMSASAATTTPGDVRAVSVTATTMTIRWDAVAGASGYRLAV